MIANCAAILTLIITIIIILIAFYILKTSSQIDNNVEVTKKIYKYRSIYFKFLTISIIFALIYALSNLPYNQNKNNEESIKVSIIGKKWLWQTIRCEYSPELINSSETEKLELPLNKEIEFQVTSADVNHGFGIYNSLGKLINQTQAMPEHINKLFITFDKPGIYQILCMEYCGIGHHVMQTSITVK